MKNQETSQTYTTTGALTGGKLPIIHSLENYMNIRDVLVVGCGGTGAYAISHLSRLINILNKERPLNKINLYLADGDIVEEKNLSRQHFINQDIGRNKAEVVGERYAAAFGMEIGVVPKDIENINDLSFLNKFSYSRLGTIIIGCVDNNASRKVILNYILEKSKDFYTGDIFWVDSGNEERNGQVVCGYVPSNNTMSIYRRSVSTTNVAGIFSLPFVTEIYPDMLESDDKFNSQISCAERAVSAPQNMQTNITSATIVMNYVNKIFANEKIKSHCVEFSIDNNYSTKLNTTKNLSVVSNTRKRSWEKK